jgi:hypothetical protein
VNAARGAGVGSARSAEGGARAALRLPNSAHHLRTMRLRALQATRAVSARTRATAQRAGSARGGRRRPNRANRGPASGAARAAPRMRATGRTWHHPALAPAPVRPG